MPGSNEGRGKMNNINFEMLQLFLIAFVMGFVLYRTCNLKRDDSTIEKAMFLFSIYNIFKHSDNSSSYPQDLELLIRIIGWLLP